MLDWNEWSQKRIIEVKTRIQTIVVYEELEEATDYATGEKYLKEEPVRKEAVVDQMDTGSIRQYFA